MTLDPRTGSATEVLGLPDTAFVLLRDLIAQRTGVSFDEGKRSLMADKLSELVVQAGLRSFLDFYYLLRYDEDAEAHWTRVMDRLSVPETFFWRQADQFEVLARVLAPEHFGRFNRPLRVWSAACCTGEEPISIAMALAEAGLLEKRPIEIVASDGSSAMIERAKRGVYGERSFRQLPAALRERYFEPVGTGAWRPSAMLTSGIEWSVVNLARSEEVARYATADVIFCRNVFIYFTDDAIRETARTFWQQMPPQGYLFLGAAESLTRLAVEFELTEIAGVFVWVKGGRPEGEPAAIAKAGLRTANAVVP